MYRHVLLDEGSASFESQQVFGTVSQIIRYENDSGQPVLLLHQFKRPDHSLGGSGKPDPKMILYDGIEYFC